MWDGQPGLAYGGSRLCYGVRTPRLENALGRGRAGVGHQASGAAEPIGMATRLGSIAVALRGPYPGGERSVEGAAAYDASGALGGSLGIELRLFAVAAVPVAGPLPDVAHDVEQAE